MSVADRQLMYEHLRLQEQQAHSCAIHTHLLFLQRFMCYTYTPFVFTKVHVLYIHTFCF